MENNSEIIKVKSTSKLSIKKNMGATNIVNLIKNIESAYKTPCYRSIEIKYNAKGGKIPIGEHNDWDTGTIEADRGSGGWISFYVKHVKNMYVIDFDTKELDGCELKDWLDKREVSYTETKKGYHYYVQIYDMIGDGDDDDDGCI